MTSLSSQDTLLPYTSCETYLAVDLVVECLCEELEAWRVAGIGSLGDVADATRALGE